MTERGAAVPGAAQGQHWMPVAQVFALAEQYRQAGNNAAAADLCQQVLRSNPRDAEALHLLGIVMHQAGEAAKAIDYIKQAIAVAGGNALFYCNLGEICRLSGRIEEAITAGQTALALQPHYAAAANNLGIAYYDREDYERAAECYRRAIQQDPDFSDAYSNLGNALRAQKKPDEAIAAYTRAIELRPGFADAYSNLGTGLRDAKRSADAETAYRKALTFKPHSSTILNDLALAVMDQKRHQDAIAILRRSLDFDPKNPRSYVYLGTALNEEERSDEAIAAADHALSLEPDNAEALNLKGRALLDQNRPEPAMTLFRRVTELKPDSADAYNNIGNALKELGRPEEATQACHRALEIDPKSVGAFLNLADIKSFKSVGDPDLNAMEALAKDMGALKEDEQMVLHFALSKAYADLKRHGEAFHHMREGNTRKRKEIEYDEAATLGIFDRVRAIFTPELVRAKTGLGHPTELPIFVLGMPRSGSTLVEQILASHPQVCGAGELKDFDTVVKAVHGPDGTVLPYPEFVSVFQAEHFQGMARQYLDRLAKYSTAASRITNKMPSSFFYVGLIHLAMPKARIVHTMRNPVDTCVSCYSKLFAGLQSFTYDLGELGRYYRKYEELMAHWRTVLPADSMLEIQYEEVVEDLETQARRIVAYCGLEWDDACLDFHKVQRPVKTASALQVRRPIYKSSVGRWEVYRDGLAPLLKELGVP